MIHCIKYVTKVAVTFNIFLVLFSKQFFIDYNLHGMNLLNTSSVKFRAPIRLTAGRIARNTL